MTDDDPWTGATWQENRRRQHDQFRMLPFREKLRVLEQLAEVAAFFRLKWEARSHQPPKEDQPTEGPA